MTYIVSETEADMPMQEFAGLTIEEKLALYSKRFKKNQNTYRFRRNAAGEERLDDLIKWLADKRTYDIYIVSESNGFSYTGKLRDIKIKGTPDYRTKTNVSYMDLSALIGFESKEHRARWVDFDRIHDIVMSGPEINPVKAGKVEPSAIMDFFGQPLDINDYVTCTDRKLVCFGTIEKFNPKSVTIKIKYMLRDHNYTTSYSKYKPYAEILKVSEEVKGQLLLMDLGMNPRGK
tara:strand:+ start:1901 stop:2599 length:699 start_codon:yes stop_codon:yes gene_type:complete